MVPANPYQAYSESSFSGANPATLVVALYEGAIAAVRDAQTFLDSGDIMPRGKAITKAVNILTELLASLNYEKGGEIARNLQQLYSYLQRRLMEAHARQTREPLEEAENLLCSLLVAWQKVAQTESDVHKGAADGHTAIVEQNPEPWQAAEYGMYYFEGTATAPGISVAC